MSRRYARLCVGRGVLCFLVHSRSLGSKSKPKPASRSIKRSSSNSIKTEQFLRSSSDEFGAEIRVKNGDDEIGNKIMVVVDSSHEAKGALEWALSHNVQNNDSIVLLHVAQSCKPGADSNAKKLNLRAFEALHSMKKECQRRRPGVSSVRRTSLCYV